MDVPSALPVDELKLKPALENMSVPSYVTDSTGIIRWLNPAAIALVGDVRGRSFTTVVAPADLARARNQFARNLIAESSTDFEATVIDAEGGQARLGISTAPLRHGGRVIGVFGLVTRPPQRTTRTVLNHPHLTPRQHDVLELLAEGASTQQIAAELSVSVETVRNHVRAVLRGLGAGSRLEAVAIARREGLLE